MYIDRVDNIVNKYNSTYHTTTKKKSFDVRSSTYIDVGPKNNDNGPKCKHGDHVRILKEY